MSFESTIIGLCVLAVILLQPPLFWHTHTRNIPAVILIIWLLIMNIISIVNAAIWSGADFVNAWDGNIWCDITTKLEVGASVGIPCAIADIIYNLHIILKATTVLENWNSWRKMTKDLLICLGSPVIVMVLSYVVQAFRYSIVRYNGCQNALSSTWLTIILYSLWMLLWSLFATIYAILVLFVFFRKRKDVRDILYCTNSGLNITRFARLLILCFVIILIMLPLSIYGLVLDAQNLQGEFNFKSIHSSALWNLIIKVDMGKPLYTVWIYVLASYLVFLVFGLGSDALSMYVKFLRIIKLGFIVDRINNYYEKNRESRIGYLMGSMAYGSDSYDDSESISEMEGKSLKASSSHSNYQKGDNTKIYVDYQMGYDDLEYNRENKYKPRFGNRRRKDDLEAKYLDHEISLDGSHYSPNLDDEYSMQGDLVFSQRLNSAGLEDQPSPLSYGSVSELTRNIRLELANLSNEDVSTPPTENPFKTPTSPHEHSK